MFNWITNLFTNRAKNESQIFSNAIPISDALGGDAEWIRIVPIGTFPLHHNGPHDITGEHITEMEANFKNTNTDLLFDYEHRSLWGDSLAAGWSTELEAREDGLYAKFPVFTAKAQGHIDDKEYRYLSPTYQFGALDKSGKEIGAVLHHVALTNTPYFDNEIDHIGNSRQPGGQTETEDQRIDMKLSKENLKKLGLKANATEEEINQAIANSKFAKEQEEPEAPETPEEPETPVVNSGTPGKDDDRIAKLEKRLAEKEKAEQEEKAELLVNSAIQEGKILPADKKPWLALAKSDYAGTKEDLEGRKANSAMPGKLKVNSPAGSGEGEKKSVADYCREKHQLG